MPSLADLSPRALIDSPIRTLALSLTLIPTTQIRWLTSLIDARVSSVGDGDDLGVCATCGKPVARDDPFLRYRGRYYHGGSCVESDPPALRARAQPNAHLAARNETAR
jgi:hypothetical protein